MQVPSHYEFQTRNQKPNTQENAGKETGKLDLWLGLNFLCAVIGAFAVKLAVPIAQSGDAQRASRLIYEDKIPLAFGFQAVRLIYGKG